MVVAILSGERREAECSELRFAFSPGQAGDTPQGRALPGGKVWRCQGGPRVV
jgi:hypothetical protein